MRRKRWPIRPVGYKPRFRDGHILVVTPVHSPLPLVGNEEANDRIRDEVAAACRVRGLNLHFVTGQFGAAGIPYSGLFVRVLILALNGLRKVWGRYRRVKDLEASQALFWGVEFKYHLILRDPFAQQGLTLFAAQVFELLADIEKRITDNYGALFAVTADVAISDAGGGGAGSLLMCRVEPDALRGASFKVLHSVALGLRDQEWFRVRRALILNRPKLTKRPRREDRDRNLGFATAPKARREATDPWARPKDKSYLESSTETGNYQGSGENPS